MTHDAPTWPCLPTEEDCVVTFSGVKLCKTHSAASDTMEAANAAGGGEEHVTATKVTKWKWRLLPNEGKNENDWLHKQCWLYIVSLNLKSQNDLQDWMLMWQPCKWFSPFTHENRAVLLRCGKISPKKSPVLVYCAQLLPLCQSPSDPRPSWVEDVAE